MQSRDDTGLKQLGARLAGLQDRLRDLEAPDRFEVGCRRFLEATERPPGSAAGRKVVPLFVGGALAAAAALLLFLQPTSQPEALSFTVGQGREPGVAERWIAAGGQGTTPIRFSDGTGVRLEPGARARVAAIDQRGARLILESGRARVNVVHRQHSRWRVDAGPFEVLVTGTAFSVYWSGEEQLFELEMSEGSVTVHGPVLNGGNALRRGQSLRVSVPESTALVYAAGGLPERGASDSWVETAGAPAETGAATAETQAETAETAPIGKADESREQRPAAVTEKPSSESERGNWKALAEEGRYEEALRAAEAVGFATLCKRLGPADLLRLAEAARFAGRAARAEQALVMLRERFARSRHAAIAAYTLGRTAFDQQAAYGKAARWFETYIEEQPSGPLAREALGRLMEARQRAGLKQKARAAASDYLRRYPQGPHADIAARLAGQ